MRLSQMAATLERELCSASDASVFHDARGHHEALAAYESPDDVLAALAATSVVSSAGKDAITRALIREYQASGHQFWVSLLIVAYAPMLVRLSARIRADVRDRAERDHLVMTSFYETIITISPGRTWVCLSLRRCTEQRVFKHLGRERKDRQRERAAGLMALEHHATRAGTWLPDEDSLWPAMKTAEHADGCDDLAARAEILVQLADGVLDDEELELVTVTLVHGERLSDHVRRRHPDLDEPEWRREYQRAKRRHSRAIQKLRLHLEDVPRRSAEVEDVEPDITDAAAAEQGVDADVIEDVTFAEDDMPLDYIALVA